MSKPTTMIFVALIMYLFAGCATDGNELSGSPIVTPTLLTSTVTAQAITETPASIPAPVPSQIPVSRDKDGSIVFYSLRDGNIEIYTMNADGSNQRRLTFNEYDDYSPAWSPDGSQIAFISDRDDPNPGNCSHACFYQLHIINADGSGERKLVETEFSTLHPDWHPDGTRISFDTESNLQGNIYVVNTDGSNLHLLIEDGFWADWSPDGSQIVFASKRDGNVELYLADTDGNNQRRLTKNGRMDYFPDWSPDGRKIAFAVMEYKAIFIIDADGSNEQQLTYQGNAENPTWSPDGTWIAYQSSNDGDFEIYAINVNEALQENDGFTPLQLTNNQVGDLWPSWVAATSTSSKPLLFEKSSQIFPSVPTWKIALADLDGDGDLDAVFANAHFVSSQVWLNDSYGFFTDSGQQLLEYGHGIDVGDLDGDGNLDVIISPHRGPATRVFLNDGNAILDELESAFEVNIGFSVDLYDIDDDGDLDAVGEAVDAVNVFFNNGDGYFTASELTFPLSTIWGDLDMDGDVDVLIKEGGIGYMVELNDGKGHFTPYWELADLEAMDMGDMALGDVDDDGDLDAIITNGHFQTTSHPAMVFINDGMGQFSDSGQRLSAVHNAGVSLGDLDNDGDLDLVLADYMEPCQIWLNDGSGYFMDSGFRFGDNQLYRHIHLGDLDGDGDLDIFLATFGINEGPNEVWFNVGQD